MTLRLPDADGTLTGIELGTRPHLDVLTAPPVSRSAYAACHVVADPLRSSTAVTAIDWDATIALRRELWNVGLGVAESMDTAQRGMGLAAADAMRLAEMTLAEDPRHGAGTAVGIATDGLESGVATLDELTAAYRRQLEFVAERGGTPVVMASRQLAHVAEGPGDYFTVYDRLLSDAPGPVILHWLGDVFDPELTGYWGDPDPARAMDTVVGLIATHEDKVAGIKISLLDPTYELELRRRLPAGVALFTGDDFNYTEMIAGDHTGHSHALLGAFAALAPWASAALKRLDAGDENGFRAILEPTQRLSRLIFTAPTPFYKVGIVWLAYLSGKQHHPRMLGALEGGRDLLHLAELIRLANEIDYFPDPEFTEARARTFFAAHGIG
jgi:hypothetical protein